MSIAITTVTNSIAAMTISGVTIKDIDEIPADLLDRNLPLLTPDPNGFLTDFVYLQNSLGNGTDRKAIISYVLNYLLITSQTGTGRVGKIEGIGTLATKTATTLDAFYGLTSLTGAVDWEATAGQMRILELNGLSFFSMPILVRSNEFIN